MIWIIEVDFMSSGAGYLHCRRHKSWLILLIISVQREALSIEAGTGFSLPGGSMSSRNTEHRH